MASFGGRNMSRVMPRLLKAVNRQRQLSGVLPVAGVWASQSHGHRLISTVLQSHEPGEKFKSNEDEMIDRMLYNLDLSIRRRGRVMRLELDKILNLIERSGVCSPNQALLVIKCCGDVLVDLDKKSRIGIADRCFELLKSCEGTVLDISHYNALMKVHLENENKVSVSDLLATIEQQNLGPNRVTYQLCVALLCQQGDIAGATAILQHMKKENLAINEAVFQSLLSAHCANYDKDSVVATLDVMTNSGLNIGAETYTVIASSYARTGQWEQVTKTLEQAEMENISFSDSDILTIIQSCSQAGLKEEAQSLMEKLPKKRGFFQEVRNSVPQLALHGNVQTAVDLYIGLKNRDGFVKEGQGMFVVSSITRADVDIDTLLSAVAKLEEDGFTTAKQFLIQEAAYNWSPGKCQQLADVLYQDGKTVEIGQEQLYNFSRGYTEHSKDLDKAIQFVNNLKIFNVKIPGPFISNDIIPLIMRSSQDKLTSQVITEIKEALPHFNYHFIANSMITYLLNKTDKEEFLNAVGFLLNVSPGPVLKPDNWNSSLARSFLHTNDSESFISCLSSSFLRIKNLKKLEKDDRPLKIDRLFRSLFHIGSQAHIIQPGVAVDDIIAPLLQDLINLKIGVPNGSKTEKELIEMLKKEESKNLLEQATKVFAENEEFWTEEECQKLLECRKKLWAERMKLNRVGNASNGEKKNWKEISSKGELEEIQKSLASSGNVNVLISSKLMSIYLNEGDVPKFTELFNYTKSKKEYSLALSDVDTLVDLLLKDNKAGEARDWILKLHGDGNQVYYSSLMNCLSAFAEQGDHATVMETLEKVNPEGFVNKGALTNKLLSRYSSRGEAENLHEVSTFLITHNFASADNNDNLVANIDVYLEQNDLTNAVAEFSRIVKIYKKTPRKFQLTCKLIEEENAGAIQEVLESSSSVIGEDRSLLDLAHAFLHLGKKVQAKKLLDTPGLRYFEDRFVYIFEQLSKEDNAPGAAESFVQITKNVFNCDRDLLFTKLVDLHAKDVDKVDDIWLQVQEEGLVPSNRLMRAIGKVFKENGREVPFGDIPEDDPEPVKPQSKGRKSRSTPATSQSTTAPNKYASFSKLVQTDKLVEANKMAIEMCKEKSERPMRNCYPFFQQLFQAWDSKGNMEAMEHFMKSVDSRANAILKLDSVYKGMLFKHNPEAYFSLISSDSEAHTKYVVNGPVLVETIEKNPSLQDKIDALASEGNITATLLSAKLSLHQKNAEKLLKSFEKITLMTDNRVYSRIFDKVDSVDKVRMSLDIVGSDEACHVKILENALYNLKETPATLDLARIAVEKGLNQTHFSKPVMRALDEETVNILTGSTQ